VRQAGAINVDKRLARIAAQIMDDQGQQVFARATLAANQQCAAGISEFLGLLQKPECRRIGGNVLRQNGRGFC
jgi:hypothetical protein